MIVVEVHVPSSEPAHVAVLRRLRQQVEDAHTAAIDIDNDEADRVVMFVTTEYQNAVNLFGESGMIG